MIRIATRSSDLARWQANHVAGLLRAIDGDEETTIVSLSTRGDRETGEPLSVIGGQGLFTAEIDRALLRGDADLAVHSLKDLPLTPTDGLRLAAIPERAPVEDVLIGANGATLRELPARARVGTSSPRRTHLLRSVRPGLELVDLRGNVPTRIARVGKDLDATILARAGVVRLGLEAHVTEVLGPPDWLPAPGQGALGIVTRADERELAERCARLDDPGTHEAAEAERAVLAALGGGCSLPLGVCARRTSSGWRLSSTLFDDDVGRLDDTREGPDPFALARASAEALLQMGATP